LVLDFLNKVCYTALQDKLTQRKGITTMADERINAFNQKLFQREDIPQEIGDKALARLLEIEA
jgi:hypothetical protein